MNIYKNKNVFISGHSGFKGSWLYLFLENLGSNVFGYSLKPNTNPSHFTLMGGSNYFNGIFADIRDQNMLSASISDFNPHIIFHLAAQPLVRESYKNPIETFEVNSFGILNLLYTIHKSKDKLTNLKSIVIITTDKVYHNEEWIWGYRENDKLGGYDPYSASKACGEIIADSMRSSFFNINEFGKLHNILIATARAGNVIGGGDFSADRLIPDLIYGIINSKTTIIRNPLATRPWQNVLEPLRGYLMLGEKLLQGDTSFANSFNFGPDINGNIRVIDMLEIAKEIWGKIDYKVETSKNNPHEATLLMLDTSKAYHLLQWKPKLSTIDSIKSTINWYKEFIENKNIITQQQLKCYMGGGCTKVILHTKSSQTKHNKHTHHTHKKQYLDLKKILQFNHFKHTQNTTFHNAA